jgi:anaerobic magnesium-protoporphyrin IX monomethyl ester cyclase
MDFLLISPPVANIGQATAALSVLTAHLRARGWDAHQWDLGIEAFHHFHSVSHLRHCQGIIEGQAADGELRAAAARVVAEIDEAKAALRRPGIEGQPDRMSWAFDTLRDAGIVLTAASLGSHEHDFRHFAIPRALASFEQLDRDIADRDCNPFVAYFEEHALPRLTRQPPRAVGISISYASQLIPALALARLIRQRLADTRIVLGGAYLTAISDQVATMPVAVASADAIVLHDGEQALDGWLDVVVREQGDLRAIANLVLAEDGKYRRAHRGPFVQTDLDELASPMWIADGLDLDQYLVPHYAIGLPLSRGCYWGRCVYCNISSQTTGSYRCRSVAQSIADIQAVIAETGSHWFDLPVDSFRPKDLRKLAVGICDAGLAIEWGAEVLFDKGFKDEVIADLARSGCRSLRFGLESGSPDTLAAMHKLSRPPVAARILRSCKTHGISTAVMFIAGFPSETRAALQETVDFLIDNRDCIDQLTVHPYSLVPGSTMAGDPGSFGIFLQPAQAVMLPNLPYGNTNPGGIPSGDIPRMIESLRDALRDHFPDLGALWSAAIGGWMTFPACCARSGGEDD